MTDDRFPRGARLYSLLLKLYPAAFRQEFGEEMHFVFTELLRDVAARDGKSGIALLWGWTLLDLGQSLLHEHWARWKGKPRMSAQRFTNLGSAILIGLILVLPFFVLEAITTSGFARSGFPLALFIMMWVLAALFILILTPMVRTWRAESVAMANPAILLLKGVFLVLLAWAWVGLVIDQMPCFLGASGC